MIENWIDEVAKVFEISNGRGGKLRSFRVFERNEFPESMSDFPCAVTYPTEVRMKYGETAHDLWNGVTELHLFPNTQKTNIPETLRYYARIKSAVAAHITLGGLVSYFILDQEGPSVQGPVALSFGELGEHMGLIVHWVVKENESVSVSG